MVSLSNHAGFAAFAFQGCQSRFSGFRTLDLTSVAGLTAIGSSDPRPRHLFADRVLLRGFEIAKAQSVADQLCLEGGFSNVHTAYLSKGAATRLHTRVRHCVPRARVRQCAVRTDHCASARSGQ
jgi:hypothetical protein